MSTYITKFYDIHQKIRVHKLCLSFIFFSPFLFIFLSDTFFHDVIVHMEEEECQDMEQYRYRPTHVCEHGAGRIAAIAVGS